LKNTFNCAVAVADAVEDLAHDHADLNRRVLALGAAIPGLDRDALPAFAAQIEELRELLFLHFAREEEGLFPFVSDSEADLGDQVNAMASAHDTICGAVARMCHLASTGAEPGTLALVFQRFETAYAAHARTEAELLQELNRRLSPEQRAKLAALVDGL
jgi:hypothetical protein